MIKSVSSAKSFYRANKTAVLVAAALFVVWRFWGFFSGVFNVLTPGNGPGLLGALTDAAENVKASAEASHNVAITKNVAPGQTAAFLERAKADAIAIATALKVNGIMGSWFPADRDTAYKLLKPYARVLFGAGGKVAVTNGVPHLRNPAQTMRVLQPFYHEYTNGRSLLADADAVFNDRTGMSAFYKQYIRP